MIGTIDDKGVESVRVRDEAGRKAALEVLGATYRNEKGWVSDPAHQFPAGDLERHDTAWFVVHLNGRPVGYCVPCSSLRSCNMPDTGCVSSIRGWMWRSSCASTASPRWAASPWGPSTGAT